MPSSQCRPKILQPAMMAFFEAVISIKMIPVATFMTVWQTSLQKFTCLNLPKVQRNINVHLHSCLSAIWWIYVKYALCFKRFFDVSGVLHASFSPDHKLSNYTKRRFPRCSCGLSNICTQPFTICLRPKVAEQAWKPCYLPYILWLIRFTARRAAVWNSSAGCEN